MRRWWRLGALLAMALGGGVALGWFVIGPALVTLMGGQVQVVVPVPAPMVTVTAGTARSHGVPHHRHLASLAPVSAVPAPRTWRPVVTHAPGTPAPTMASPARSATAAPTMTMTPTMTPSTLPPSPSPASTTPTVTPSPPGSPPSTTAVPAASTSG